MLAFEHLAEQRIVEAIGQGQLDNLPGAGRPLDLADDPLVPADQRMANRILKNAGFTPPELGLRQEITTLRAQLELLDEAERGRAWQRLCLLMTRLTLARREPVNLSLEATYWDRLKNRLDGDADQV